MIKVFNSRKCNYSSSKQRQWCIGNIEASQALAPGSTPGWRKVVFFFFPYVVVDGGVAQMVERLLCMQEAQGSIPCSSTDSFFFVLLLFRELKKDSEILRKSRGVSSVVEQSVAAR